MHDYLDSANLLRLDIKDKKRDLEEMLSPGRTIELEEGEAFNILNPNNPDTAFRRPLLAAGLRGSITGASIESGEIWFRAEDGTAYMCYLGQARGIIR